MKKENVLFENQKIIVLKDVKDYQDFDYSYFENCEIEKSCIYHKITYALAVLKKVENGSEKFIDGDGNTDYSWLLTE